MDIVHICLTLEDQFSGAKDTRIITRSQPTFEKMKAAVGATFSEFDKQAQIRYNWKVLEVRQAAHEDYKTHS